ncbi:hypothetical protein [Actinocorallia herbida]|uniref:hypothetical protein n=1 Tax=Actinocorallia herbida TaxID=58109 RepID=UPI000F4C5155|nr:hypothetical protein [Actinocorallia herbida]
MAGWDVTVLTPGKADPTALRILGARSGDLEAAITRSVPGPRPVAVAVEALLCETEPRVGSLLRKALDTSSADIRVWGAARPATFADAVDPVRHRLSTAARAFKSHALAALPSTSAPHVLPTETFHRTPSAAARS